MRPSRREEKRLRAKTPATPYDANPKPSLGKPFVPLTDAQEDYASAIDRSVYTFGVGPAGTGKTYVAACKAAEHLRRGDRSRVILTRPAIEAAGEKLGFLPGTLADKFGPYMKPLMNILLEQLGSGFVECAIKNGRIQMIPMAFMRGETFKNAFIIADEMQNATQEQLKMLLTRLGQGSKMVVDGDPAQTDIGNNSGLTDAVRRMQHINRVSVVRFAKTDIVRHDITQSVVEAYEDEPSGPLTFLRQSPSEELGSLRDLPDPVAG